MSKILVDTSVWIDFFKGHLKPTVREGLEVVLDREQVAITDVILHEILVGSPSKKEFEHLNDLLSPLEVLYLKPDQSDGFNQFAWNLRLQGLKGSYTDTTIAFLGVAHKYPILSFDKYFKLLHKKGIVSIISFES